MALDAPGGNGYSASSRSLDRSNASSGCAATRVRSFARDVGVLLVPGLSTHSDASVATDRSQSEIAEEVRAVS